MATDAVTVSPTINGDSVPLTAGMIVRLKPGANNNVVRAQADSAPHVQGVNGVVISGAGAPGTSVLVACIGRQTVQMESSLVLSVGDTVYVSPTVPGKGTNVQPGVIATIGSIADISNYVRLGTVEVDVAIGDQGTAGATGPQGATGAQGSTGMQGFQGAQGPVAFGTNNGFGPQALGSQGVAATAMRSDSTSAAYRSDLPLSTTWFIDPVSGSDAPTNPGTTNATALLTLQELKRRWWGAEISSNTTVTILGNLPNTDVGAWYFTVAQSARVTFIGSLGVTTGFGSRAIDNTVFSGSVTGFVAATDAPSATDSQLTDTSVPVSFTASGMLALGVLFKRTSSTALYWYAAKDLGSQTIRVSPPMLNAAVQLSSALTPGDTYAAYSTWTIYSQDFGAASARVRLDSLYEKAPLADTLGTTGDLFRCWADLGIRAWQGQVINCAWNVGAGVGNLAALAPVDAGTGFCALNGGMMLGSGAGIIVIQGRLEFGGALISQGVQILLDEGFATIPGGSLGIYDCTIDCFLLQGPAVLNFAQINAGNGLVGKGNTAKLLTMTGPSSCYYGLNSAAPPFFAGSTSDAAPIQYGGVAYPVSALLPAETILSAASYFPDSDSIITPTDVDLTAANPSILVAKGRPGYIFLASRFIALVTSQSGAFSTAPTITGPMSVTGVGFSGTQFAFGAPSLLNGTVASAAAVAAGTDITIAITVGATGTGGFTWKARIGWQGRWVKL